MLFILCKIRSGYLLNKCPLTQFSLRFEPSQILHISNFLSTLPPAITFERPLTTFERICQDKGPFAHALLFSQQLTLFPTKQVPEFIYKWERDLNITFIPRDSSKIFLLSTRSSISNRYQESGYKLLSQWYRTPKLLHSIYPLISDSC